MAIVVLAGIAASAFYYGSLTQTRAQSELRVGVLPDQDPAALRSRFDPLIHYLGQYTGLDTRLVIPENYADAVRLFKEGAVDLAFLGGLTFVQAHASAGAEALVMREVDTRFTSWFVARPELTQSRLSDLKGKTLVFGSRLSTSGHLMPRYFLQRQWNIEPEKFFSEVRYSGAHDETVYMVRDDGQALGAVNADIARQMLDDGRLGENELKVLWQTPPYPDYVWAVQPGLDEAIKISLRDAFLVLDPDNPGDATILLNLGAKTFLPAGLEDFRILGEIAQGLGMIENPSL